MADNAKANARDEAGPAGRRFWKIAAAGATFQAGSSAVDSATVVSSLLHMLTGNPYLVGGASAILRLGWLLPQFIVGYLAQKAGRRMPYYVFGAYGRAIMAGLIGLLLWFGQGLAPGLLAAAFLVLWTGYAFISGIVAVPYNDIVGRSIPGHLRSRMLAWRFFGGGLMALGVAMVARRLLESGQGLSAYAMIFWMAAALMILSSTLFVSAGEPEIASATAGATRAGEGDGKDRDARGENRRAGVAGFIRGGMTVLREDARFRLFLFSQWLGGATLMAMPFYMVAALDGGIGPADVALLLGAQTTGALLSNPVWGLVGDRLGKIRLMQMVGVLRLTVPLAALLLYLAGARLGGYIALYLAIGAMMNGVTIGYLGFLMEISPDDRRPAYSAYFNTLAAPAALLPLFGAVIVSHLTVGGVFAAAVLAALLQLLLFFRIENVMHRAQGR